MVTEPIRQDVGVVEGPPPPPPEPTPSPAEPSHVHPELVEGPVALNTRTVPYDPVDEWGRQSFPASDPPANW